MKVSDQEMFEAITSPYLPDGIANARTYEELFARYADSELGQHHTEQELRFHKSYPYNSEEMLMDLGPDVHPVLHSVYTHDEILVPALLAQNYFTDGQQMEQVPIEDIPAIRIGCFLHDVGECEHPLIEVILDGKPVGGCSLDRKNR